MLSGRRFVMGLCRSSFFVHLAAVFFRPTARRPRQPLVLMGVTLRQDCASLLGQTLFPILFASNISYERTKEKLLSCGVEGL